MPKYSGDAAKIFVEILASKNVSEDTLPTYDIDASGQDEFINVEDTVRDQIMSTENVLGGLITKVDSIHNVFISHDIISKAAGGSYGRRQMTSLKASAQILKPYILRNERRMSKSLVDRFKTDTLLLSGEIAALKTADMESKGKLRESAHKVAASEENNRKLSEKIEQLLVVQGQDKEKVARGNIYAEDNRGLRTEMDTLKAVQHNEASVSEGNNRKLSEKIEQLLVIQGQDKEKVARGNTYAEDNRGLRTEIDNLKAAQFSQGEVKGRLQKSEEENRGLQTELRKALSKEEEITRLNQEIEELQGDKLKLSIEKSTLESASTVNSAWLKKPRERAYCTKQPGLYAHFEVSMFKTDKNSNVDKGFFCPIKMGARGKCNASIQQHHGDFEPHFKAQHFAQ